jgi:hypothetical protein
MKITILSLLVCTIFSLNGCSKESTAANSSDSAAGAKASVPSLPTADLQVKLCKRLKEVAPKLGSAANAQALLVVEIADEFDYNPEVLSQVKAKIDELALNGCAAERQSILATIKMASLQDAVR